MCDSAWILFLLLIWACIPVIKSFLVLFNYHFSFTNIFSILPCSGSTKFNIPQLVTVTMLIILKRNSNRSFYHPKRARILFEDLFLRPTGTFELVISFNYRYKIQRFWGYGANLLLHIYCSEKINKVKSSPAKFVLKMGKIRLSIFVWILLEHRPSIYNEWFQ